MVSMVLEVWYLADNISEHHLKYFLHHHPLLTFSILLILDACSFLVFPLRFAFIIEVISYSFTLFLITFDARIPNALTLQALLLLLGDELTLLVLLFLLRVVLDALVFLLTYALFLQLLIIDGNVLVLFQVAEDVTLLLQLLLEGDVVLHILIDEDALVLIKYEFLLRLLPFFSFSSFSFFLVLLCFINHKKLLHLHLFMLEIIN